MENLSLPVQFLVIYLLFSWLYVQLSHFSLRYYAAKYRVSQYGREEFLNRLDKSFARTYRPDLLGKGNYDQKELEKLGEKEYFQYLVSTASFGRFILGGILFSFLTAGVSGRCKLITQQDSDTTSILGTQYLIVELFAAIALIRGWRFGHSIREIEEEIQQQTISGS